MCCPSGEFTAVNILDCESCYIYKHRVICTWSPSRAGSGFAILWGVIRALRWETHLNFWDDEALIPVEGFNQLHVIFWQGKVKHLQVLLDPGGCHTFRDTHYAPLNVPPADVCGISLVFTHVNVIQGYNRTVESWFQSCTTERLPFLPEYDLSRCFLVSAGNGSQSWILQETWLIRRSPGSVPTAQRTVCCHTHCHWPEAEIWTLLLAQQEHYLIVLTSRKKGIKHIYTDRQWASRSAWDKYGWHSTCGTKRHTIIQIFQHICENLIKAYW